MSECTIVEEFNKEDADDVCRMMQELAEYHGDTIETNGQDFIDYCIAKKMAKCWVAKVNGVSVGFVTSYDRYNLVDRLITRRIDLLFVLENHRKKSVGKNLIKQVAKDCVESGVQRLEVTADVENGSANKFYTDNGFVFKKPNAHRYRMDEDKLKEFASYE